MRTFAATVLVAFTLCAWGCSNSDDAGGPLAPTPAPAPVPAPAPAPAPPAVVTINIVAINGAQSFSPNPATLPAGQLVVWHNIDRVTHRVVLNNGSLDTGDIAAGASSQPMALNAGEGAYFCSIHPSMVGNIVKGAAATASRR